MNGVSFGYFNAMIYPQTWADGTFLDFIPPQRRLEGKLDWKKLRQLCVFGGVFEIQTTLENFLDIFRPWCGYLKSCLRVGLYAEEKIRVIRHSNQKLSTKTQNWLQKKSFEQWYCSKTYYNYFLFCHPEMFKAVYLYEKSLLWNTIWVGYALGPKVHKKKFWWSYDTPNAKSVTFCESTYVFWRRPVADVLLKWVAGHSFQFGCLRKNKSSSDRRVKDINQKSVLYKM